MQVRDVMTRKVISVTVGDSILAAARLMLQNRISGLPVVDAGGNLVGVVTEGDFLRRGELGTQRSRPKWLEFLLGPGRLANEYVHAFGRKVSEIMTADPICVTDDNSLQTVVELMERGRVKRLPVIRAGRLVGIVSRANLVHAALRLARDTQAPAGDDAAIREPGAGNHRQAALGTSGECRRQERHRGIVGHDSRRTRTQSMHRRRRECYGRERSA